MTDAFAANIRQVESEIAAAPLSGEAKKRYLDRFHDRLKAISM